MSNYERPLSPHLQIYRWQYSNAFSILNRLTGLFLTAGTVLLVYWLAAAAQGPVSYASAVLLFSHPLAQIALFLWLLSYSFHTLNGVRHLVWDTGHGLERRAARISGWVVFVLSIALSILIWLLILTRFSTQVEVGGLV